jgi:hypothetical protein
MWWWDPNSKREPTSTPLSGPPPVRLPCKPTLVLGLHPYFSGELGDVYRNDLVYCSTSRAMKLIPEGLEEKGSLLKIFQYLDGTTLKNLSKAVGGTQIVDRDDLYLYNNKGGRGVNEALLSSLATQKYQAIICADSFLSSLLLDEKEVVGRFIQQQYYEKGVSVVIMGTEHIFNFAYAETLFGVSWSVPAYTKRDVQLTDAGEIILSRSAFPSKSKYTKSHFVVGDGEELFSEFIDVAYYESEMAEYNARIEAGEDPSTICEPDPIPRVEPGSPVITHIADNKSLSYFGFANSLDVSYGAIILRLCFAAQHRNPEL